jgi:hypothetical protein
MVVLLCALLDQPECCDGLPYIQQQAAALTASVAPALHGQQRRLREHVGRPQQRVAGKLWNHTLTDAGLHWIVQGR